MSNYFTSDVSRLVWETRYRYREGDAVRDGDLDATWQRVAHAVASVEPREWQRYEQAFHGLLQDFTFLPGGRILAGAGTAHRVTLFNCFVMGLVEDSMEGIFAALREAAVTMQQGGGVGYDFSTLRPCGSRARAVGGIASGPVSFMRIWDSMCATLQSTGARRGAMMATLRCDHPDILAFIDAKRDARELRHFNLSVLVTDAFMKALRQDADWELVFPAAQLGSQAPGMEDARIERAWPGYDAPVECRVLRVLPARELWSRLMRASYDCAEPGVLFIDRINHCNNLRDSETISATNPCGEIPLPPYGACDLGSLNLTRFVAHPFSDTAALQLEALAEAVRLAVRFLDNVIDVSLFPLPQQQQRATRTRRIGLGITGLADALIMLGVRYGSPESLDIAARLMRHICHEAYAASVALAQEKGRFPDFNAGSYLQAPFVRSLPARLQAAIAAHGIRNSHLLAIAPTGTVSLLANNVSSGVEPVFRAHYNRRVEVPGADARPSFEVVDHACRLWQLQHGPDSLPPALVESHELSALLQLKMQAALQPYVDNAISKTINVPEDQDFDGYRRVYEQAYELGLKGCTTFRPNPVTGSVLSPGVVASREPHCCDSEREPD